MWWVRGRNIFRIKKKKIDFLFRTSGVDIWPQQCICGRSITEASCAVSICSIFSKNDIRAVKVR